MDSPLLSFQNVKFTYPGSTRRTWTGLTFAVQAGDFIKVAGPSGSGKSTLLRLCVGFEIPTAGEISYKDKPLSEWDIPCLRQQLAYVPQVTTTLEGTIKENLLLPYTFSANKNLPIPSDEDLQSALARLTLPDVRLDDSATALSVGQMQRICFLRTLMMNPAVLLLDEPESALDEQNREILRTMVMDFHQQGGTVLWVSHNEFNIPGQYKVLSIADGKAAFLS